MPKPAQRLHARDDGQGLVELIVALTVLAIGIGALLTVLTSSALSLQRSGQKGTALSLAEKQIELYRNLTYGDIRLDKTMPLVDTLYTSSYPTDPSIPDPTKERTDADAGTNPCTATPECEPVQLVGPGTGTPSPDNRKYRIDTYIYEASTNGGDNVAQVYVVVRNAQISTYPVLARSASTISAINIANRTGKSIVTMSFTAQRAALQGTSPDQSAIKATLFGGVNETGDLVFYVLAPPATPSAPCTGGSWKQVDSVKVSGDGDYYPSAAALSTAPFPFSSTGTYYWYATYSGDPVNKKASSPCGATMQATTVRASKLTPTLTLASAANAIVNQDVPGSSLTVTVAGSSGYTPNPITLMAYGPTNTPPSSCTTTAGGLWRSAGSVGPNGDGSYSPSATFKPTSTGRYWWYASYPGDGTNNAATSRCDGSTSIAHVDVTIPPDTFSIVSLSGSSQIVGAPFSIRITAMLPDGSGPDTAYTGTLSFSGPATSPSGKAPDYPPSLTFTSGVATGSVTLYTAETASITATQGLVKGTSDPITVQPSATAGFSISPVGAQVAGTAFGVGLTAVDAYGNPTVDSNYDGGTTHTFTWTGAGNAPNGQAPQYGSAATTVSFNSGVGTAAGITLLKAASTVLTATESNGFKGTSQPFTVKGAAPDPSGMRFINCSKPTSANTGCTGQPIQIGNKQMTANIGLLDAYGNAASATAPVTVTLSSSGGGVTVTTPVSIPQGSTQSTQLTVTGNNASATITAAAPGFANATLTVQK
ncbi:MAG TPA: hypothetical protein VFU51_05330 [Gaiellaceae bacterium]|nr:hypothetical protein [Gaiellaceae bacterium]